MRYFTNKRNRNTQFTRFLFAFFSLFTRNNILYISSSISTTIQRRHKCEKILRNFFHAVAATAAVVVVKPLNVSIHFISFDFHSI